MRILIGSIANGDEGGGEEGREDIGTPIVGGSGGGMAGKERGSHSAASDYLKLRRRFPHDVCGLE